MIGRSSALSVPVVCRHRSLLCLLRWVLVGPRTKQSPKTIALEHGVWGWGLRSRASQGRFWACLVLSAGSGAAIHRVDGSAATDKEWDIRHNAVDKG